MNLSLALKAAQQAASAAGELIRNRFPRSGRPPLEIHHKGRIDLVTEVDLASEQCIRSILLEHFPHHQILGEEGGVQGEVGTPRWIVDPLDGTRSFAHGYPFVSVAIALEWQHQLQLGLVYDPLREEMFWATRGGGSFLNGEPIRVSAAADLSQALLVSGFPYQLAEIDSEPLFALFKEFVLRSGGIRRDGSAALDFCYVACGRLDGFWEFFLKPWDGAAGALIVEEAGGIVSDFSGRPFDPYRAEMVATNPALQKQMLELAQPYLEGIRRWL